MPSPPRPPLLTIDENAPFGYFESIPTMIVIEITHMHKKIIQRILDAIVSTPPKTHPRLDTKKNN